MCTAACSVLRAAADAGGGNLEVASAIGTFD
jgi:hypothetical protein